MPKRIDISKILIAVSIGVACFTFPNIAVACEATRIHVPLDGEWQPYFELVGANELFQVLSIEGSLEVRHLVVTTDGKHADQDGSLGKVDLKLRNALSGYVVKSSATDEEGYFTLSDVKPGSYVLEITQSAEPNKVLRIHGNLLIELRADAKELHLPLLALYMTDCGMEVNRKNDESSLKQNTESTHAQTH